MTTKFFNFGLSNKSEENPPKKLGIVTGAHDLSQVESMIQRYLELAETAFKTDGKNHKSEQKTA